MSAIVQAQQQTSSALAAQALPQEAGQYLTFLLGGEIFAVGILAVKEIIEYPKITEVPMMPDSVRGVINLRGAVVPVMDVLARFGRPPSEVSKRTCIVIVEVQSADEASGHQIIGVVVDAVNEVLDIAPSDIEPAPAFGAHIRTDFIQGMGKVNGKFVILLNVDHVLSMDEATLVQITGEHLHATETA